MGQFPAMASTNPDEPSDRTSIRRDRRRDHPSGQGARRSPAEGVLSLLRLVTFWMAVFLPFVVGGMLMSGLGSADEWRLFGLLGATSVLALYVGHPYARN